MKKNLKQTVQRIEKLVIVSEVAKEKYPAGPRNTVKKHLHSNRYIVKQGGFKRYKYIFLQVRRQQATHMSTVK